MRRNKKGFTLIELLAVIVILAIIALIAVPMVLSIINKTRKAAFMRSAENVLKASDLYYAKGQLDLSSFSDIKFNCSNHECISDKINDEEKNKNLSVNGDMGQGYVQIYKTGEIEFQLSKYNYCAVKYKDKENIELIEESCEKVDMTNDQTAPLITGYSAHASTNSITLTINAKDPESGISHYEYSMDNGTTWEKSNSNVYETKANLKSGETYKIIVRVYNNTFGKISYTDAIGRTERTIEATTSAIGKPTITMINDPENPSNGYLKSQTAVVKYDATNITNPVYFVRTTRKGISNLEVTEICLTNNETDTPGECTNIASTTTLEANVWYKVSGDVNVTYEEHSDELGVIFALTYDGVSYGTSVTYTINKIDKKEDIPVITLTSNGSEYVSGTWTEGAVQIEITPGNAGSELDIYEVTYDDGKSFEKIDGNILTIDEECSKTIKVRVTDKFGNTSGLTNEYKVNIDRNKPVVTYSVAGGNYNKPITVTIVGKDANYSNMAVRVFNGKAFDYSKQIHEKSNDVIANGVFDVVLDSDGIYTIYTDIIDLAGNSENQTPNNGEGSIWYYQEYTIDTTDPTISVGVPSVTTNSITLPYTVIDNLSAIKSKTCKYGTKEGNYTNTAAIGDTTCVLNGVTAGTTYYYEICATDALDNKGCVSGNTSSAAISLPGITLTSTPTAAVNGYYQKQVANVTYNTANITSPQYFVRTTKKGISNINAISCTTNSETDTPNVCNGTSTTTLEANVWYKVSGNVNVTYNETSTATGTIFALTYDGTTYGAAKTYTINKIDATKPSAPTIIKVVKEDWTIVDANAWHNYDIYFPVKHNSTNEQLVSGAKDDLSGVNRYQISSDNKTWYELNSYNSNKAVYYTTESTKRYYRTVDNVGNVSVSTSINIKIDKTAPTTVTLSANSDSTYAKTKSVTVTLKDTGGSGLAAGSFKYGWSTSTSTAPSSYTTVSTAATTGTNTTTFKASGSGLTGSYYLWVVPVTYKDNVGRSNTTTVKSTGTFKFDNSGPTVTASAPTSWTSGNKTITASATDSHVNAIGGYYIGTTTTAPTASSTWQTGTTFSKGAGTYYVWAKDSLGNISSTYATVTVGSIDTVAPSNVTFNLNTDSTYGKTKNVTVTLKDTGGSGLAAGSFKYGWSTSTSTAPSSYTTVSTAATIGTNTTTFKASGSGLTGSYYLWVVPVTYKDNVGRSNTTTVKSTGTFKFDNSAPGITIGTVTTTDNTITIPFTITESHSGVSSTTCVYGTSTSYGKNGTISENTCTISGLVAGTTYYYKITSTDKSSNSSSKSGSATTAITDCHEIRYQCENSCSTKCETSCTTSTSSYEEALQYCIDTIDVSASCSSNCSGGSDATCMSQCASDAYHSCASGTCYGSCYGPCPNSCILSESNNKCTLNSADYVPTITLGTATVTDTTITLPYTATDSAGIKKVTCKIGAKTGTISGDKCTISGLSSGQSYTVSITAIDNYDYTATKSVSVTTVANTITYTVSTGANVTVSGNSAKISGASGVKINFPSAGYSFNLTENNTTGGSIVYYNASGNSVKSFWKSDGSTFYLTDSSYVTPEAGYLYFQGGMTVTISNIKYGDISISLSKSTS